MLFIIELFIRKKWRNQLRHVQKIFIALKKKKQEASINYIPSCELLFLKIGKFLLEKKAQKSSRTRGLIHAHNKITLRNYLFKISMC